MSVVKKKPYSYPNHRAPDAQESLRLVKLEVEHLTDKLKSILDNPKAAKKAAMLISLWIEGKKSKTK